MRAFYDFSHDHRQQLQCRLAENIQSRLHFHSNIELIYVLDGKVDVTINDQIFLLSRGCAAVSGSYDFHRYQTVLHSKAWILIIPVDSIQFLGKLHSNGRFSYKLLNNCLYDPELRSAITCLQRYDGIQPDIIATGYICVVMGILTKQLGLCSDTPDSGSSALIQNILKFMAQQYSENITLESVSQKFGYSKTYISRVFNATLNCGFNHYLNALRARHAAALILGTEHNLEQIAQISGFQSVRTFNRAFVNLYGMTPFEYRKSNMSLP